MKKIILIFGAIFLTACAQNSGNYSYPGYYQPAQFQTAYVSEGHFDGMGNYHPPVQKGGEYLSGRWYRPQPGNPKPTPQRIHAQQDPFSTPMGEIGWLASDGDVGTAPTRNDYAPRY
jgi:hypothetical protein